jgi:Na+-driven multidrug efflux pump
MASEMGIVNFLLAKTPSPTESIAAFSIYHRVVLFASQPMIATAVAMLPFAGRLLGERDIEGIRKGLRQGSTASLLYCLVLGPLMIPLAPVIAGWWAEAETTRMFAETALLFVPIAGVVAIPFFLGRPVFEAMGRGRPGLQMATLRYLVLSVPLAWGGLALAPRFGFEPFFGVLAGMIAAAGLASLVISVWVNAALRQMSRDCPPDPRSA